MGYRIKQPDAATLIGEHETTGARLYAELAPVPLYVNVRVLGRVLAEGKRRSFYLGWVIGERRLAAGKDRQTLPADFLAWVTSRLLEVYPDHATATGLSDAEVAELKREQDLKRKAHERR